MAFVLRLCLWLILIGLFSAPVVAYYALEDAPLVTDTPAVGAADIRAARVLLEQLDPRRLPGGRDTKVIADQGQINMAIATALAAVPGVNAKVVPSRFGVLAAITAKTPVPQNPFGRYANVRMLIEPSDSGLRIGRLSVGDIEVPAAIVRPAFVLLVNRLAGRGRGQAFLDTIRSVAVRGDRVEVVYRPRKELVEDLRIAARNAVKAADPARVRIYYRRLMEVRAPAPPQLRESFARYLREIFGIARSRSASSDPVEENKAAIFALAMMFGDLRVERFVGEVRTGRLTGPVPDNNGVRLQGRHDWVQHFTLSAALQLAGGRGIADFIGEAKEVQDAGKASGFSFTDIAADRTGVRFAEVATASAASAQRVQRILSGPIAEPEVFPNILDLPEGLTDAEFRERYRDRGSEAYRRMMVEIDGRIARIPLYQ